MVSASWLMAVSMLNFFASHCLTLRSFRSRSNLGGDVLRDTRKSPVFFDQFQERYLVGGWPSPLKNDGVNVSWDMLGWWHVQLNGKNMFQTTNQLYMITDWPWGYREFVPNQQAVDSVDYDGLRTLEFEAPKWIQMGAAWPHVIFHEFSPHVLQQGNLGIISSRSAYWSYFASQISQLDLGSCLISGKPCSITFKSFDFVLGGHHTSRFQKDVQHQTPLREFSILLKARASLQVKLQLVVFSQLGCHLPPDGKAIVLDENLAPPKKLSKSYSFGCF